MRVTGFEPAQALSRWILSPPHLTGLWHTRIHQRWKLINL